MRTSREQLDSLAIERGLKMTPQRRAIVEYLESAFHHPTADEVFIAVNAQFPLTSRATVYNTLHLLKEMSLVREISREGVVRFDPNLDEHHHFICRKCGRVEDLPWDAIPPIDMTSLEGQQRVESFDLILHGLCASCDAPA
jgi:Fur family transcriptional regulator, peroxide stress response regulator